MYVATVPNRNSPPARLLRESYRQDGKVKTRTLANITHWPQAQANMLHELLQSKAFKSAGKPGATAASSTALMNAAPSGSMVIERALPHGHVAAVLGMLRQCGLGRLLLRAPERVGKLLQALIVARVIEPAAKLATARQLSDATAAHSLGAVLGLKSVDEDELYAALDYLYENQPKIEVALAKKHLNDGCLVLYDVSSSYVEGRCCELAQYGHNRDGKKGKKQIVFGLLCASDGCPVAVEVFEGNTSDPTTIGDQISKVKDKFKLKQVVLVGDRGMITSARIREELKPAGLDWITALRAREIQALAADGGPLQLDLFDDRDMAAIESPDYPGERLIVCRNNALANERTRKRNELLETSVKKLNEVKKAVERAKNPLRGKDKIAVQAERALQKHKMAKHFTLTITDDNFSFAINDQSVSKEKTLDGFYVIRTNVGVEKLQDGQVVGSYKSLSQVERAFRSMKTVELDIRPLHHRLKERVRAHVFLCMLAYYVIWHMRQKLAPMLFEDTDKQQAASERTSPVAKAEVSRTAREKTAKRRTPDDLPVHSFRTLLQDLATLTHNTVRFGDLPRITMLATATPIQAKAFELLGVSPDV
jgi:transposase